MNYSQPTLLASGIAALGVWVALPSLKADVLINEIGAADNERLLKAHEDGRPRLGWGTGWMELDFDDSSWETGTAPFGFGNDIVVTDLGEEMIDRTPSLYLRKTFTVSAENAAKAEPFRLSAKVDGGFVAYVNGVEIARANLGRRNGFVYADQSAFSDVEKGKTLAIPSEALASDMLVEGENVLAIQVQNRVPKQINERDNSIDTEMYFDGSLNLGLGIFAGGSNIPLGIDKEGWKYRVGHAEPSGGLVDWAHVVQPELDGDFANWIELHNNGATAVDIGGWHMTDDRDEPKKWAFPAGTSIAGGGYLVILADGRDGIPGDFLHTNFKLSASGEFFALNDASGALVSDFDGRYPVQKPFHSFGRSAVDASNDVYFSQPTPGAANAGPELVDTVDAPDFEPAGGVYDETTVVTLTSETEDAVIRYTTDGSEPTEFHGQIYDGPITVEKVDEKTGTPIRARAFKEGHVESRDKSQTYLVGVDDVFKTIRTISLISDGGYAFYAPHGVMTVEGGRTGDDWVATSSEDYYMPDMHGRAFERRVSMELIYPDSGENVQVQGGIRLAASAWSRGRFTLRNTDRSPWQSSPQEKPSFNMFFRSEYGDDALNHGFVDNYPVQSFTQLRMRAGKNDINNPWIHDELSRRVMADTGQFSSVGIQTALFVNGVYKGFYDTVSRLRGDLFQEYYGGDAEWDVKHIDVWADGDGTEWAKLEELLDKDLSVYENYQAVTQLLDPVNLADYFIVNIYGATWDWPHNNFVIARERSERGRWRAYMWDAEGTFGNRGGRPLTYNSITADLKPGRGKTPDDSLATMWNPLIESPEFRMLFADRLQKHFFTEGGALTQEKMLAHVVALEDEIGPLMSFNGNGTIRTAPIKDWIQRREDVLFKSAKQFEDFDLWSDVQTPFFAPGNAEIASGTRIEIKVGSLFAPQKGDIFYTTDGSDPRLPGGEPNPSAQFYDRDGSGFELASTTTVKARVRVTSLFDKLGTWSALQELNFMVDIQAASSDNLLVTELMVDPPQTNEEEEALGFTRSDFEFVELYNPTETEVDVRELRFSKGIQYIFEEGTLTTIPPKGYGLLVRNIAAFEQRYGSALPVMGSYSGKLSNDGEEFEITNGSYQPIVSFTFGMIEPWPVDADRGGMSLTLKSLDGSLNPNDATSWALSAAAGGTPGRAEGAAPVDPQPGSGFEAWKAAQFGGADLANEAVSGMQADPDGDGLVNLVEFAFGSLPKDGSSSATPVVSVNDGKLTLVVPRRIEGSGLTVGIETSADLSVWQAAPAGSLTEVSKSAAGPGIENVTWQWNDALQSARYVRWRIEANP